MKVWKIFLFFGAYRNMVKPKLRQRIFDDKFLKQSLDVPGKFQAGLV